MVMRVEQLEKWVSSPIPGRRRKALQKLTKEMIHGEYDLEKLYESAKKLLEDENWSVRVAAIKTLTEIALRDENKIKEVIATLEEKLEEENPNVLMATIDNLAKLYFKSRKRITRKKIEDFLKLLEHEKSNVREAVIRFLKKVGEYSKVTRETALSTLMDTLDKETAPNVISHILDFFSSYAQEISSEHVSRLLGVIATYRRHESVDVRRSAVLLLKKLLESNKLSLSSDVLTIIKKALRDEKLAVRDAAVDAFEEVLKKDPRATDELLGVVTWEVMMKEKNERLVIKVLDIFDRLLTTVPVEIINKHEIPRALDIIEKNTYPKNPERAKIKELARRVLEEKLGYTFEKRKKKFGST